MALDASRGGGGGGEPADEAGPIMAPGTNGPPRFEWDDTCPKGTAFDACVGPRPVSAGSCPTDEAFDQLGTSWTCLIAAPGWAKSLVMRTLAAS
mmetsp:Transcript_50733/g.107640  ORF Transcript_50733/g.107640 Transcript_50733/m.107640 type:complete len:94 (-) Transcript_50733:831-1112(-)